MWQLQIDPLIGAGVFVATAATGAVYAIGRGGPGARSTRSAMGSSRAPALRAVATDHGNWSSPTPAQRLSR